MDMYADDNETREIFDLILYGGVVRSMDEAGSSYEAIAVKDGRIAFLGTDEEAAALKAERRADLAGCAVYPGFTDGHMHMLGYAFLEKCVKLYGCKSAEEMLAAAAKRLEADRISGEKIKCLYGRGWNDENFVEKRYPLRSELDALSADIPIVFVRVCGHIAVCNSLALEKISNLPEFRGLENKLDFENGLIYAEAVHLSYRIPEKPERESIEDLIIFGTRRLNEAGITGVQTEDFVSVPGADWEDIVKAYQSLEKRGLMTARVYQQCIFERIGDFRGFLGTGYRTGDGGEFFRIGPLKLIADGSLGAKTAALTENYEGDSQNGLLLFSEAEMDEFVRLAHESGMQIAVHCIGDRAMKQVLAALERAQAACPRKDCRHGIVHAQITDGEILARMRADGIAAYIQPVFVPSDMGILESRIGKRRAEKAYAWKTMLDMGILTVGGSDAPVEPFDVIENIYYAVSRRDKARNPKGGWKPEEKVSIDEAVRMFTVYPAYASFSEAETGTLAVGKRADLVVLSRDLLAIDPEQPEEILKTNVVATITEGKTVFKSGI